ncbi:hypothetical protein F5Y05DRAFT_414132 [Hypoxylon sp. FL0543]|nr:hypothetical protein F5Y05DRAFT_414132 [Hypoxylon sp. FL0543]
MAEITTLEFNIQAAIIQVNSVWAIWTPCYYHYSDDGAGENVLYVDILRLVLEGDETANKPVAEKLLGLPEDGIAELPKPRLKDES